MSSIKDNANYSIRLAIMQDLHTLINISAKTFTDTFAEYNSQENMALYLEENFNQDQLRNEISDPSNYFVLVIDQDEVIGYAKLRENTLAGGLRNENAMEIERLYIAHEHHGKRAGAALMQACLDIVEEKGYNVVWLGVWEHNARAIDFYNKWGFEKIGDHKFLLGNDLQTDLVMKKTLA
jgi:ribosomal protein S18 acetylase RimI-like enzyme